MRSSLESNAFWITSCWLRFPPQPAVVFCLLCARCRPPSANLCHSNVLPFVPHAHLCSFLEIMCLPFATQSPHSSPGLLVWRLIPIATCVPASDPGAPRSQMHTRGLRAAACWPHLTTRRSPSHCPQAASTSPPSAHHCTSSPVRD